LRSHASAPSGPVAQDLESLLPALSDNRAGAVIAQLESDAAQGDLAAKVTLGRIYLNGIYFLQDMKRGCDLFEEVARAGNAEAAARLALCFEEGAGREADVTQATAWYEASIDGGYSLAKCLMGEAYIRGSLGPADPERGIQLCLEAALDGVPSAQLTIATHYLTGEHLPQDSGKAHIWMTAAAQAGIPRAQYNLAIMYENGDGTERSLNEASYWYQAAARQGYDAALLPLARLYYRASIEEETGDIKGQPAKIAYFWLFVAQYRAPTDRDRVLARQMLEVYRENVDPDRIAAWEKAIEEDLTR